MQAMQGMQGRAHAPQVRIRSTGIRRSLVVRRMAQTAASGPQAPVKQEYVALAHDLADAAGRITSQYFRTSTFDVENKLDASPVTIADRKAEEAMRTLITAAQPHHSVFGEEFGLQLGQGTAAGDTPEYLWVLDPIDGTKSFITGKPLFGTLVSLLHRGTPVIGIIDQPITRERWVGVAGQPTTLNGRPIKTRHCQDVASAFMYSTTPHMFSGDNEVAWQRVRDAVRIPLYGCDCYAYGLLAAGQVDLVVEADLKVYDYMALVPVIQGAGGLITDWAGRPLRWQLAGGDVTASAAQCPGEVLAAGDARTHEQVLQLLQWKYA